MGFEITGLDFKIQVLTEAYKDHVKKKNFDFLSLLPHNFDLIPILKFQLFSYFNTTTLKLQYFELLTQTFNIFLWHLKACIGTDKENDLAQYIPCYY